MMNKPRMLGALCGCIFVFLSSLFSLAFATSYTLIDLGTLGGEVSEGYGINDNGQVVGSSATDGAYFSHAFIYDGNGQVSKMQDLDTLGGTSSHALNINYSGQVVGDSRTYGDSVHPFLYDGSTMRDLGTLGGTHANAFAINNKGQVVGSSNTVSDTGYHAFLYDGSTMRDLGTLGGSSSSANDINDKEQVVGQSHTGKNSHAFLYDDNMMRDLGTLGGPTSTAYAINNNGYVVGSSQVDEGYYSSHAFVYDGSTMRDLGTLGGEVSEGYGINDSGQVVGSSWVKNSRYVNHAYLYDGDTMLHLCAISDCTGAGWEKLENARAINNRGEITGTGTIGGKEHAYLAIPSDGTLPDVDLTGDLLEGICAIVLAGGQIAFSCNRFNEFSLKNVARENNATVKRQIYADGYYPRIDILPGTTDETVRMEHTGDCPSYNVPYDSSVIPSSAGKWINIFGNVLERYSQTPICALVLANGQHMFSCDGTGR